MLCALMKPEGIPLPSAINSLQAESNISECEAPSKTHRTERLKAVVLQLKVINSLLCSTLQSILSQPVYLRWVIAVCGAEIGNSTQLNTFKARFAPGLERGDREPPSRVPLQFSMRLSRSLCDRISSILSNRRRAWCAFITLRQSSVAFVFISYTLYKLFRSLCYPLV